MKSVLGALALAFAVLAGQAQAKVITFDDRSPIAQSLSSYEGFDWKNMSTLGASYYEGFDETGYGTGTVSAQNVAFNGHGDKTSSISLKAGTFNFESAFFTAAWLDGLKLRIEGFNNGVKLYSETLNLDTAGPKLFNANWTGVDKLTFVTWYEDCSDAGRQFVMDNLNLSSGVPEPSTWAMMVVGFGGVGFMIRSTRRRELLAAA